MNYRRLRSVCVWGICGFFVVLSSVSRGEDALLLQMPRVEPTAPANVGKTMHVLGGFTMDLIAHEPLVTGPVAMAYDPNGLAYVVEMIDYPYTDKSTDVANQERTTDRPIGRCTMLEDIDGDGKFDRRRTCIRRGAFLGHWHRSVRWRRLRLRPRLTSGISKILTAITKPTFAAKCSPVSASTTCRP